MEFQEIQEGFLLICNELRGNPSYPKLMELYNRASNIKELVENGLEIEGVQYDFDVIEHIDNTKLALDQFVQDILDSDAIVQGHRKITSAFATIKKQQAVQEEEKENNSSIIVPLLQVAKPTKPKLESRKATDSLDEDLPSEMLEMSTQMKKMALYVQEILKQDKAVINKTEKKQEYTQSNLKKEHKKLEQFMKSKSLNCSTLALMLATSICMFVFAILFIRIF